MKKLVLFILIVSFAVCNLFAMETTNYIAAETDYSFSDSILGISINGEFAFNTDNMEKRLYPFAVAGLGFRIDMSQEQFSFAENAIPVKLGGGILFRIKNNFYVFANAELSADIGKENKDQSVFKFSEAGLRAGVQLANGSLGVKAGAFAGYLKDKGFTFRPFVSGLLGIGGNRVTKYDRKTGELDATSIVADNIKIGSYGLSYGSLPSNEGTAFSIMAYGSKDWYFRFSDYSGKVAPILGFDAGLGYGTMGLTVGGNFYGGAGFKLSESVYANLGAGLGFNLGFFKGFESMETEQEKLLVKYFGWLLPNGYQAQVFAAPSITFIDKNSSVGFKVGCDVGYTGWANVFAWGKKIEGSRGEGNGLFMKAYVSFAAKQEVLDKFFLFFK